MLSIPIAIGTGSPIVNTKYEVRSTTYKWTVKIHLFLLMKAKKKRFYNPFTKTELTVHIFHSFTAWQKN